MGGSVGKVLGAIAGAALVMGTGGVAGASLLGLSGGSAVAAGAALGAAAGNVAVDQPAKQARNAEVRAQQEVAQAQADAKAAASATRTQQGTGAGVVPTGGAQALGETAMKDTRGQVRKKKKGASALRIDPLASAGAQQSTASAATGTATTGQTGLKV